jgi:hypothetical protein
MGYKEEMTLDILDLGKHILMHWRMLVLGCFMGALIAGMVTVYKGVGLSQSGPDVSEATENVNVVPGVEGVEPLTKPEFGNVTTAINNYYDYKDVLAKKMKYKEDSLLLNLDNTCVPTMERNYLISDYYEIEFPNLAKANYIENIIEMYRSAIVSDDSIARIKKDTGWENSNLYIRELINVELVGNSILQVKVVAPSKQECDIIMQVVDDVINGATAEISKNFSYNLTYLSENYSEDFNAEITNNKKVLADDILAVDRSIAGIPANLSEREKVVYSGFITDGAFEGKQLSYENALTIQNTVAEKKALEQAQADKDAGKAETVSAAPAKVSIVKNMVLGMIGGIFLAIVILIAGYAVNDRLKTADDLVSVFKCPVLEVIDDPSRKFGDGLFGKIDKTLDELLYRRKTYNDTLSLSASQIKLGVSGIKGGNVLLTNSYDSNCDDKPVMDLVDKVKNLAESGEEFAVEYVNRAIRNAVEIEKIVNMDCAVIIERLGKSKYEDINKTIELLKKSRIEVLGAVVIG